jgi:hypothetical protein
MRCRMPRARQACRQRRPSSPLSACRLASRRRGRPRRPVRIRGTASSSGVSFRPSCTCAAVGATAGRTSCWSVRTYVVLRARFALVRRLPADVAPFPAGCDYAAPRGSGRSDRRPRGAPRPPRVRPSPAASRPESKLDSRRSGQTSSCSDETASGGDRGISAERDVLLTLLHPVLVSAPIAGLFCERTWRHALAGRRAGEPSCDSARHQVVEPSVLEGLGPRVQAAASTADHLRDPRDTRRWRGGPAPVSWRPPTRGGS